MNVNWKIFMVALLFSIAIFSSGCSDHEVSMCPSGVPGGGQDITGDDVFICPDGTKTRSIDGCSYPLKRSVDRTTAKDNAQKFIIGYVRASGWNPNVVNTNFVNGSYETQVIVSRYEQKPFETILLVDGATGTVSCKTGCFYLES